jgi:hypothetical protein
MEHRWGRRFPVDLPVRLVRSSGVATSGRVRNLSTTGAFVESSLLPPAGALVYVERRGAGPWPACAMAACVIWQGDGGVGLEWCEPAEHFSEMLAALEARAVVRSSPHARPTGTPLRMEA